MKKFLNSQNQDLISHMEAMKARHTPCVYNEIERPKNATRFWISYDIDDEQNPTCRTNIEAWLHEKNAESFGGSVATFLVRGVCYSENLDKVAKWLVEELIDAEVLNAEDTLDNGVLSTPGLSLYIFYRSRNAGDGSAAKRYSNQFVLIQNKAIMHPGGY